MPNTNCLPKEKSREMREYHRERENFLHNVIDAVNNGTALRSDMESEFTEMNMTDLFDKMSDGTRATVLPMLEKAMMQEATFANKFAKDMERAGK